MLGIFVLISYWLAGSVLVEWLHLPIPGSVIGLLALWISLLIYGDVPNWLKQPSSLLLRYLTLLFVPAGVGLIEHWGVLQQNGLKILVIITASSLLAALVMVGLFKLARVK